jgi:hypothetical protein
MGTVGLISYPDSGPIGSLADLFATFAGSINQALPVKFVATLSALNAISMNASSLPMGTLATLTADDSGLAAGAQFAMHPDGDWRLIGSCNANNVATFVTAIITYTNIKTLPGATCWNATSSSMVIFTSTSGTNAAITTSASAKGAGTTTAAIAVSGTLTIPTSFPAGTFSAVPSQVLLTADSGRLTCAAITRTSTGFIASFSNWSNGALATGTEYTWTAWA